LAVKPGALDAVLVTGSLNEEGVVCVRFWVNGAWQHLFMDDTVPCKPSSHRLADGPDVTYAGAPDPAAGKYAIPYVATGLRGAEVWPSLLEKAWARLHGSYAAAQDHVIHETDSQGSFPIARFVPHSLPGVLENAANAGDALWAKLRSWAARGWPMTVRSLGGGVDADGLVGNHAFSLMRVFDRGPVRLVQLRNPWGRGEWTGAFSDGDKKSWTPELQAAAGVNIDAGADDGVFWMPYASFTAKFKHVMVTPVIKLVNDGGTWHKATARGAFSAGAASRFEAMVATHYFFVKLHAPGEVHVQLVPDGVLEVGRQDGSSSRSVGIMRALVADGNVRAPLKGDDFSSFPPAPPRAKPVTMTVCTGRVASSADTVAPSDGVLVLLVYAPEGPPAQAYTISVCAEVPFDLRVADPAGVSEPVPKLSDIAPGAPDPLPPVPAL